MKLPIGVVLAWSALAQTRDGTVILETRDALTKAPLPNAGCHVNGPTAKITREPSGGTFQFEGGAGSYDISCDVAGYRGESRRVRVAEGATERVVLDLVPNGSLEGVVRDEDGRPMAGVVVYTHQTGRAPQQHATTDREGKWIAKNMAEGEYRLQFRVPYEIRKATLKRNEKTGEVDGYPHLTYFPGTFDAYAAAPIQATAGATLNGFDVRLRRTRLVALSVRLEDGATHQASRDMEAGLITPMLAHVDQNYAPRKPGGDGLLHFDLLLPGRYELSVGYEEAADEVRYIAPIEVGKAGLANFVVRRPPLQKIAARVEPLPEGALWEGSVAIGMFAAGTKLIELRDEITATADGFPPGKWRVYVTAIATRKADGKKLAVARAMFGAQDALTQPIEIAESGNPVLTVRLTADTGGISGVVERREGAKENSVYLRRRGVADETGGAIAEDGTFAFRDLAPAMYELVARMKGAFPDPKLPTTTVEVKAGETVAVRLQVR